MPRPQIECLENTITWGAYNLLQDSKHIIIPILQMRTLRFKEVITCPGALQLVTEVKGEANLDLDSKFMFFLLSRLLQMESHRDFFKRAKTYLLLCSFKEVPV